MMPTFRRDDTAGILAVFGQTPAKTPAPRYDPLSSANAGSKPAKKKTTEVVLPTQRPTTKAPAISSSSRSSTIGGPPVSQVSRRPYPPVSTGPMVGPGAGLRATTAGTAQYTDNARRSLRDTPLRYSASQGDMKYSGLYSPKTDSISINAATWDGPNVDHTLRHEFSHNQWFDQGWDTPEKGQEFVTDTFRLARDPRGSDLPTIAIGDWVRSQSNSAYGYNWSPAELHGRVGGYAGAGAELPAWYRNKWFPDTYTQPPAPEGPLPRSRPYYDTPFGAKRWNPPTVDTSRMYPKSYRPEGYRTPWGFDEMYQLEPGIWVKD